MKTFCVTSFPHKISSFLSVVASQSWAPTGLSGFLKIVKEEVEIHSECKKKLELQYESKDKTTWIVMSPIYRNLPTTTQALQKDKKVQLEYLQLSKNAFTAIR